MDLESIVFNGSVNNGSIIDEAYTYDESDYILISLHFKRYHSQSKVIEVIRTAYV